MKIALPSDDGLTLAPDFTSCRSALVFDLVNRQITNRELRRPPDAHSSLLPLLADCAVLFAAAFDHDSLHALQDARIRPLLLVDPSLPLETILTQLTTDSLRVKAPAVCTHDHK